MVWKRWPYWIRGALIAVAFGLLLESYTNFLAPPAVRNFWIIDILELIIGGPIVIFGPLGLLVLAGSIPRSFDPFMMPIILFIEGLWVFLLGAFLGWLYGKWRARRRDLKTADLA